MINNILRNLVLGVVGCGLRRWRRRRRRRRRSRKKRKKSGEGWLNYKCWRWSQTIRPNPCCFHGS
jgi:hypothetical protein